MFLSLLLSRLRRYIKLSLRFSVFILRLIKLMWRERKNEFSFVTFHPTTGNYKVLTYLSCRETMNVFCDVLSCMQKQLFEALNPKPDNPNHWSSKEGNV